MLINELIDQAGTIMASATNQDLIQVNLVTLLMYICNYKLQVISCCTVDQVVTLDIARNAIKTERKKRRLII